MARHKDLVKLFWESDFYDAFFSHVRRFLD
jgi:hypothetical protein